MSENLSKPKSKRLIDEKSPKKSRGRPPKPKEPQIELGMHSVCNFTFNFFTVPRLWFGFDIISHILFLFSH